MTNYRQILMLHAQEISGRGIATSCQCSRNTVAQVLERAEQLQIKWLFEVEFTDEYWINPHINMFQYFGGITRIWCRTI